MHPALQQIIGYETAIARPRHPALASMIDASARKGELARIFPGVYAPTEVANCWRTVVDAVGLWDPDAVVLGQAAAASSFLPTLAPSVVEIATRRQAGAWATGRGRAKAKVFPVRLTRRLVPPELTVMRAGVRFARPDLTAIDLIPHLGTDVIDAALRSRMVTLAGLNRALQLTPGRRSNADRLRALIDSRTEPWSALERLGHRHLLAAGITDWVANVPLQVAGFTFYQDIAMKHCPLTIEFDGYEWHSDPQAFEDDRLRGNYLLLSGRDALHFTWLMVSSDPAYYVRTVLEALARY